MTQFSKQEFRILKFGKQHNVVYHGDVTFCKDYRNGEEHYYYWATCKYDAFNVKELFEANKSFTVLHSINEIRFTIEFDEFCGVDFIESKED